MKLHLPFSLRRAVLSCVTAVSSFSATLATGTLAAGALVFAVGAQAEAGSWLSNGSYIISGNEDTITEPAGTDFTVINTVYTGSIVTFNATAGATTHFKKQNGGSDLTIDSYVIDGSAAIDLQSGYLWIKNVSGILSSVTNAGDMQLGSSSATTTIGSTIHNTGSLTLKGKFAVEGELSNFDAYAAGSEYSDGADGFMVKSARLFASGGTYMNSGGMSKADDHLYFTHEGSNIILNTAADGSLYFADPNTAGGGTVYWVHTAGKHVSASGVNGETGYQLCGAGSILTVDEDISSFKDGIVVNTGASFVDIMLTSAGRLDVSKLVRESGKVNVTLGENAALTLDAANAINGAITVGSGAKLTLSGAEALQNAASLTINGGGAELTKAVNVYGGIHLSNGATVSGGSLQFTKETTQYYLSVDGEGNNIASELDGTGALIFDVDSGASLELSGKVNHIKNGEEAFQKINSGTLVLGGTGNHVIAGQLAHWGGEIQLNANTNLQGGALVANGAKLSVNNKAHADIRTLNLSGGAFAVDSTSSATINTLTGNGGVTVANGGSLTLNEVDLSAAMSIDGTVIAGTGFKKTGNGSLTLDVLKISGSFNMNGHANLNVSTFDIAANTKLVYSTETGVLNIGNVTTAVTLNVTGVLTSLDGSGICTGIAYTSDADFALLAIEGITNYSFYNADGFIYIKAEVAAGSTWDENWGIAGLANPPTKVTEQESNTGRIGLSLAATKITGGGSDTTLLVGGTVRTNNTTAATAVAGDSWVHVTGGTFQAVVGGNYSLGDDASGGDKVANFDGDSHVQLSGGTTQFVIGGNKWDYACPVFTGDTYLSVFEGGNVTDSVIGGSTMYYGQSIVLDGNTNVFVYNVLQDASVVENAAVKTRGFVVGGNYVEDIKNATHSSTVLSVTGDTKVTVDLSAYKGCATEFTKHVVGGHYMKDGGAYTTQIGGSTHVNIVGKEGISFSGDIVGGTWADSAYLRNDLNNTELTISGKSVFDGCVVGGVVHNSIAGSSYVTGTVSVNISGGTFNNHVAGGSSLGFVAQSQSGTAEVKNVSMNLSGGTFNKMVAGGSLVLGNGDTGYVSAVSVDNVTMELGGTASVTSVCGGHLLYKRDVKNGTAAVGNVTINFNGAEVGTLYGGCYVDSNNGNTSITQGDIVINLNSGKITGTLYAAGGATLAENMTTASATVNVGKAFDFSESAAIYGAYSRTGEKMQVTQGSTLSFAETGTYTNTANLTACDFDTVYVAAGTETVLSGIENGSKPLTKSGDGKLSLISALAADAVNLRGGMLEVAGVTSKGLAVDAVAGAGMHVKGGFTLAVLTVDMAQMSTGSSPVLTLDGALSAKDNVLKVNLLNYDKLKEGTYKLISASTVKNLGNIVLEHDAFTGAATNMEYKLVLSETGLEFRYLPISTWQWEGDNDEVWSDDTNNGWVDDTGKAENQTVYFNEDGAKNGGIVQISGEVTPQGIEILGGNYTFKTTTDGTGSIVMESGETLNIASSATLNMDMANTDKMAGTVNLQGTLVLKNADGLGNATLQFSGGILEYADGISTDVSEQVVAANGVKVQVSDTTNVTWGSHADTAAQNSSGVVAALSGGVEKSGAADFSLQLAHGDAEQSFGGKVTVKEGILNIRSVQKGTAVVKLSGAVDIAEAATLHVDSNLQQNGTAVELAGPLTGTGTLSFGKDTAGEYKVSGFNTAFEGDIEVAAERRINFAQGSAAGSAMADLLLDGGTFSVGGGTVAAQLKLQSNSTYAATADATFTGELTGTDDTPTLEVTGGYTTTFAGKVANFGGTVTTGDTATVKFTGTPGGELQATLGGSGSFCTAYDAATKITGQVTGSAGVQQSGKGLLILASSANNTSGVLAVDSGCTVQLGDAATAAAWAGLGGLTGGGTFVLANGTLSGLTQVTGGTKLEVCTPAAADVATYALRSTPTPAKVKIIQSDLSKISAINLAAGTMLETEAQVKVGSGTALTLNLTSANFGAVQEGAAPQGLTAMINTNGNGLEIDGTNGVNLKLDPAALLTALAERGTSGDVYLRLADADLSFGNGVDVNKLLFPNLEQYGVKALADAEAAKAGYVIINGDISGVYFTKEHDTANTNLIKVNDARLATYSGVVVNAGDTLEIALDGSNGINSAIINNLVGAADATLKVTQGDVMLRNFYLSTGLTDPDYTTMGADNIFGGSIAAGKGTLITISGAADAANQGSLTVGGNLQADAVELQSGALHLQGADNRINDYTAAAGTVTTLAAGQSLQLHHALLNGTLQGSAGSALHTSGNVQLAGTTLSGVALSVNSGKVDMDGVVAELESLTAAKGATLSGIGAVVTVGDYIQPDSSATPGVAPLLRNSGASSTFAGTLAGSVDNPGINYGNDLYIGSNHTFSFANATGSSRWNTHVQGHLVVDASAGKAMELGQLSLKEGSHLTLRFNSDLRDGSNLNVLDLQSLDLASPAVDAQADASFSITLVSTGLAQLDAGRYVLGTLPGGISFDGIAYQATEVELTDITLNLQGTAFSRIDIEQCKLLASEGNFILNLVKSEANPFQVDGAEPNTQAGATLLWNASAPEDGDLQDVYNSVNYMLADGNTEAAARTMAAVAGASATTLGTAFSGDVERQLRAIRNRTTTMGVDQCVCHDEMPYLNAWINAEGNHAEMEADGLAPGYTLDNWGGTIGFDVDLTPRFTMGMALTAMYGDLSADGPEDSAEGDLDTYYLSAFARYSTRAWTHTFIAAFGKMDGTMERTLHHTYGSYTTEGETDGSAFGLMYEVGRTFALDYEGNAAMQLIGNIAYRHINVSGYEETASDAALRIGDQTLDTFTLSAGARVQAVVGENIFERTSVFEARALAKFDVGDRASAADVALIHGSGRATAESAELGAFGVELGAGLSIPVGNVNDGTIFFDVSAELRSGYTNVNGTVGYRINF